MTIKEIMAGLKFTIDMFLFDPDTGKALTEPRNDMDKTTIDACNGAIELLEQTRWIYVSERLPETPNARYIVTAHFPQINYCVTDILRWSGKDWLLDGEPVKYKGISVIAWMPLPEPCKAESEE